MSEFQKWWPDDTVTPFIPHTQNNDHNEFTYNTNSTYAEKIIKKLTKEFYYSHVRNSVSNDPDNVNLTELFDRSALNVEDDYNLSYYEDSNNFINSSTLLLLIIIYGVVVLAGVVGNASLVITLCSASSIRLRNPLLVALCLADLLVAGVSAPSTILTLALTQRPWTLSAIGCKAIYYLQSMPVAASTISFLMLSLDRYITVQHPTIAQIRQRRYVHAVLAIISWIAASAVCIPFILAYKIASISIPDDSTSDDSDSSSSSSRTVIDTTSSLNQEENYLYNSQNYSICRPDYGSNELQTSFIILHTVIVFIFPGLGVLLNHYGVRKKLCALSLTARAAHGELPLPMPILRRPTHMIIVTGMANAARGVVSENDSSEDAENHIAERNLMRETIIKSTSPKSPRVMREIRAQQQRQKKEGKQQNLPAAPGLPLPQTSTLRSRRRLANMLVAAAIIFVSCWTPHVFCILWSEFGHKQYCSMTISYISLLLGYTHSVISPIIYWILNYNTLRQSPCAPFMRINTVQRFLRTRLRRPTAPPPPSSTNEAALGAFNPRYIKSTPKQYRAQASSHYLY